jgi:Xaa-Pro aminopeptidase
MTRLARLAASLTEPLLVTDATNVRYLTGFESSNSALLVEPEGTTTLYTDFRYLEAARAIEDVEVSQTQRDVAGALAEILAGKRVGFEALQISYLQWEKVGSGGAELVPTKGLVEALRRVKDETELDAIRRAAAIVDAVYEALSHETVVGRTEVDVAWWLERTMREHGADALAFDSIVAAGVNGSRPHADPADVAIEAGTLVTVDMGCVVDGYRSDCTRTFATGDLPAQLEEAYGLVAQAQLDGLAAVRPGAFGPDVDAASRVAISEAGLADAYGHGLGHGVGLDIHEAPNLRPESTDTLAAGNVVTVEPGLYLPGVGGCRIEDLVVVTDDGCEILSSFTKEMLVVA